ncbi:MAG TPA: RelA/SpoT family protein [Alphaproteobacteria bacterium]|nr:RelA/SpoT family protein [Alphaproteobacteria bacterium]
MVEDLNTKIVELISKVRSYNPNADTKLIDKAARFSHDILSNKKRLSGDDFFTHSYNVAMILSDLKLGSHTIVAGLLHTVIDEGNVKPETITKEFGAEILSIIQALSRLKNVNKNLSLEQEEERRAENIRRIMLASSKDIRVIIIKIVERLESMRTLKVLPSDMQKIIAKETMTIYAPIAHKLGMYIIKAELEDLSFRYLENKKYLELKSRVAKKKAEREQEIKRIIEHVKNLLKQSNIAGSVDGRAKHFYSIYKKIISEDKKFDEIYDLMAVRIIVSTVDECYKVLGLIHHAWKPMPERFKDFIALPKSNGYQSLHTGVFIGHGSVLEVQIRTKDMHLAAEEGIAAHWRYKGDERDKKFDRHIALMKQILDWQRYSVDAQEFIESLKIDLFEKEIFVFTPKGDPIALAENATTIDFAYAVHTDIGNHCKQAKVNGAIVPLDYTLSPGDVVEILTQKNATPSRSWLSFAKSAHTRTKIRAALNVDVDTKTKKRDPAELIEDTDFPDDIIIDGKKFDLKIPKCCNPRIGDKNRAFKTKDGKIVVHKVDCPNVYTCDMSKEVTLSSIKPEAKTHPLRVDVKDRLNVLSDTLNFIAREKYLVDSVNTRVGRDGRLMIHIDIIKDPKQNIKTLMETLKKQEAVINVMLEDERHTQRFTRLNPFYKIPDIRY